MCSLNRLPNTKVESMTAIAERTGSRALSAIEALDLTNIKRKLMQPEPHGYGWTPEQADEGEKWYKRYLTAVLLNPSSAGCVPNLAIDRFWHCHILDTQKYMADCEEIFGYYLHHGQYLGMNSDEEVRDELFEQTNRIYRQEFGEDLSVMKRVFPSLSGVTMCEGTACVGSGCRHHSLPIPRLPL